MRDLTFTVYERARARVGEPTTRPWESWVGVLTHHAVRGVPSDGANLEALERGKDGPAIVLAEIAAGKPRKNENVRAIHALSIDIEGQPDEVIERALKGVLDSFEWIAHTTHKHAAPVVGGGTRLRVIIPLAEPMGPSDHAQAWSALNAMVGGINDPATRDRARLNYLPSTYDASIAWALRHPGRWLTPKDLEPWAPTGEDRDAASGSDDARAHAVSMRLRHWLKTWPKDDRWKPAVVALLEGQGFLKGTRHETIKHITWAVADREPRAPIGAVEQLFENSIAAMKLVDPSYDGMEDVRACWRGAVEKVRAFEKEHQEQRIREAMREIAGDTDDRGPYGQDDLARIAGAHGWKAEELQDRWVLMRDGQLWILGENGDYHGAYQEPREIEVQLVKLLRRAPVRVAEATERGVRFFSISDIARRHGTVADRAVADMTVTRTTFNPRTRTLHELVASRQPIAPVEDPTISKWLELFAGPQHEKLLDWLACCPDLSKPLCGLHITGAPAAGKTLLAHGLASIWSDTPTSLRDALDDFNEPLSRCPIILGDEKLPQRWGRNITSELRELIGASTRPLRRKYKPVVDMIGCMRVILTANNRFLLDARDMNTRDDLDAVAQRFLHIEAGREAADLLSSLPKAERERWRHVGLAAHALWLAETREIEHPGQRFWVDGTMSDMFRLLMTGSHWNSLVSEFLVRYLDAPNALEDRCKGLVKRGDGELLINEQAVIDGWDLYMKVKVEPETRMVTSALKALSIEGSQRRQIRTAAGKRVRMRLIDIDNLIAWADEHNFPVDVPAAVGQVGRLPGSDDGAQRSLADIQRPVLPGEDTSFDPETFGKEDQQ
jgi:hypothetical protein